MDDNFSLEKEQEALAELDRIKAAFEASSPDAGKGLGEGYADGVAVDVSEKVAEAIAAGDAAHIEIVEKTEEAAEETEEAAETGEAAAVAAALMADAAEDVAEDAAEPESEEPAEPEAEESAEPEEEAEDSAEESAEEAEEPAEEAAGAVAAAAAAAALTESEGDALEEKGKEKKAKKEKPKKEKRAKGKKKKHIFLKILLGLFIAIFVAFIGACVYAGNYVYDIIQEAPEINPNNIYDILSQNSTVYDVDGNVLTNLYKDNEGLRTNIDYKDFPENLKNAFLSIEDKTFWDHNGFNIVRIIGALWNSAKTGFKTKIQGTSTITQQLARNIFLQDTKSKRSMERKITEAYYTLLIEKALSKEQILEAYLNTVYLGFNSNGVAAAAKAYFNKDVGELNLMECATLAGLPQNPKNFAPLKRVSTSAISDASLYDIVDQTGSWTIYYNDSGENRTRLVLKQMYDQGKIDLATYEKAKADTIRPYLDPGLNIEVTTETTYMTDFVVSRVLADLQKIKGLSYTDAWNMLYTGGLDIYTTIDMKVQSIVDEYYKDKDLFPKISTRHLKLDGDKNILNDDKDRVMLYNKDALFDEKGNFILKADEFEWKSNGDLLVKKGGKFNFYKTTLSSGKTDVAVYIKDMYYYEDDYMYSISNCYFDIASKYKTKDSDGNLVVAAQFMKDFPNGFMKQEDGSLKFHESLVVMKTPIIQPQSAMVIVENSTGYLRAMIGGRNISGSLLFNRATTTRQPGSSIKPLSVYSTALQKGLENARSGSGTVFTAAYAIDDVPTSLKGRLWPQNVTQHYDGITYLRDAVRRSVNACAVSLYNQLNAEDVVKNLENLGITTLVKTGESNDISQGALAIGGMTNGVTPLEMASAYSTFGNYGTHIETTCYTKIVNKKGDTIIDRTPEQTQVLDESVASLMLDILQSVVNGGTATNARIKSQPTAGKTGTTNDMFDIWFCGLTPKYTATIWIGCDVNVNMNIHSEGATKVWGKIMEDIGALDEKGKFEMRGSFVRSSVDKKTGLLPSDMTPASDIITEIFISGTQPRSVEHQRQSVLVCGDTGYKATPLCTKTGYKSCIKRPGGLSWEGLLASLPVGARNWYENTKNSYRSGANAVSDFACDVPDYYCPIHNPDPKQYPISPLVTKTSAYDKSTEGIDIIEPEPDPDAENPDGEGGEKKDDTKPAGNNANNTKPAGNTTNNTKPAGNTTTNTGN
ncbi:MAG: transglycosylase domain-containing protein [Firmicutes bacterium]|nr:transglycosylase domain-containing protein [Bacillota bacterium]